MKILKHFYTRLYFLRSLSILLLLKEYNSHPVFESVQVAFGFKVYSMLIIQSC